MALLEDPYPEKLAVTSRLVLKSIPNGPSGRNSKYSFAIVNAAQEALAESVIFDKRQERERALLEALDVLAKYAGGYWMLRLGWMRVEHYRTEMQTMLLALARAMRERAEEEEGDSKRLLLGLETALKEQMVDIPEPTIN